jgi:phosphoesterase RecJ-like protein
MLELVIQALSHHQAFVVVGHMSPDGDSLGSILGLCHLLRSQGKVATAACLDHIPEKFCFLPGIEDMVRSSADLPPQADCLVIVDCGDIARTGVPLEYAAQRRIVNIDHHRTNQGKLGLPWVDERFAATGEQIFELSRKMEWKLDTSAATCIYTALATDTGFFRFSNTTPGALNTAAELVGMGVDFRAVAEHTVERRSLSEICVLQAALPTLKSHVEGKVWTMDVRAEACKTCSILPDETEGLVEYPRGIPGTEVAVLLRELGPQSTRVSLRSRGMIDVSLIASHFGGGGHARASGCTLPFSLDEAKHKVVQRLEKELGSND